jgi:hypothetical protein
MVDVTNRAQGPRFFWEKDRAQPTVVYPGQTVNLDLADPKSKVMEAYVKAGEVEVGGSSAKASGEEQVKPGEPAPANLETLTDDELREYMEKRGAKADKRWSRERLLDEARGVPAQG